ncbi:hypothetical protein, partial [Aliarcobacter cryaerophilus]|uniref:hypothetical protein n=1 Tax=Aliarcobacter cryaerophilus TaxID=28198 RepID=UPI0021B4BAB6
VVIKPLKKDFIEFFRADYLIYPFDELIIKNSYNYFKNKELKLDILFFDVYKKEFVDKNIEL